MRRALQLAAAWAPRASDAILAQRVCRQLTAADTLTAADWQPAAPSASLHTLAGGKPSGSMPWDLQPAQASRQLSPAAQAPSQQGKLSAAGQELAHLRPLLHASTTDEEHPLGEGRVAWPFNARAYYVGAALLAGLACCRCAGSHSYTVLLQARSCGPRWHACASRAGGWASRRPGRRTARCSAWHQTLSCQTPPQRRCVSCF